LSAADAGSFAQLRAGQKMPGLPVLRAKSLRLLDWLVAFWVFTGGMVLFEPSPYELSFLLVLPVALFAGFGLHRSTLGLLALFVGFIPFALIGAFQSRFTALGDALIFVIVTVFLLFTSYFVANYVADAPVRRMKLIVRAYAAAAVISALVGALAYLGLIPGAEQFLRYDRAKAFFQDPNVFGPFLILPAMYALQRILLGNFRQGMWAGLVLGTIFVGVFVSFSRAAWGHMAFSAIIVFALCFLLEAGGRAKARMLIMALAGALLIVVSIIGLLSIPAIGRLFEVRTASQEYDSGETGRFGRQAYAFELALAHPLGIGPLEFRHLRIVEEPHNTYVSVLHVYGWGGGFIYYVLVIWTLWRAVGGLLRAGPNRLLLIPLVAVFIPLAGEAAIIDTDHWRHYFLVVGLIWGVTVPTRAIRLTEAERRAVLP
jgi:O-antigen ligase